MSPNNVNTHQISQRQLAELRAHVESLQELDLGRCIELENELRESLDRIERRKARFSVCVIMNTSP
jgi:hypothetical protein